MTPPRPDTVWIHLDETTSTLDAMRRHTGPEGSLFTAITADYQSAGRGQGTNTWVSERGQNLLLAVRTRPHDIAANRQFALSEAMALAVLDTLTLHHGEGFTVKWPNDVYWHDSKICGTLTECCLRGNKVLSCTMGTGINVNQRDFGHGLPNPVSLSQITGHDIDREQLLQQLLHCLAQRVAMADGPRIDSLHSHYLGHLYRREGMHTFASQGEPFRAHIDTVTPDGHLVLSDESGHQRTYAFKEVEFVGMASAI